jgi:hypothetical protein
MSDRTFVFVAGLHRSGTSLLFRCLRDHPSVSGFQDSGVPEDEGQHLQTVFEPAHAFGRPGTFGFNPAAYLTESSKLVCDQNREKLFREWSQWWDLSKPVLIEKSPPNLVRTRFLQAMFSDSRFIVITRHPIANAYATQKWSRTPLWSLVHHWLVCHERFEADRPRLRHVHVLRYEDFVREPERILTEIHGFLGLEPHPLERDVDPQINARYLERWMRRRSSLLSAPYVGLMRRRFESRLQSFGYSLDRLEPVEPDQPDPRGS